MLVAFGCTLGGLLLCLLFQNAERRRWHQTIRLALEKNQSVLEFSALVKQGRARSGFESGPRFNPGLVIGGMINVAIGLGLFTALLDLPGSGSARFFVLIPAFVGAALLASSGILSLRFIKSRLR